MDKGAEKKEEKVIEFYDDNFEEFPEDVEELNAAPDETNLWEDDVPFKKKIPKDWTIKKLEDENNYLQSINKYLYKE